jgi:hypothetical protein
MRIAKVWPHSVCLLDNSEVYCSYLTLVKCILFGHIENILNVTWNLKGLHYFKQHEQKQQQQQPCSSSRVCNIFLPRPNGIHEMKQCFPFQTWFMYHSIQWPWTMLKFRASHYIGPQEWKYIFNLLSPFWKNKRKPCYTSGFPWPQRLKDGIMVSEKWPLLGNGSVNTFRCQQIHMQQQNCWMRCFPRHLCRIRYSIYIVKGKLAISSSQNFLLV